MHQPTPSPNITEKPLMNSHDNSNVALTKAEAAVLTLVDAGLSNQQIAARLAIGVGTVKCHLHRVYEKLQVRNRTEAAARAREDGHLGQPNSLSPGAHQT